MVKNPPEMQKAWVRSLGWEDPLKESMATHSSILAWRIPWTEEPGGLPWGPWGHKESDTTEQLTLSLWGFPDGTRIKNPPASAGDIRDTCLILGSGRSPGGGPGNSLQYI